jgi:hypothetical protein
MSDLINRLLHAAESGTGRTGPLLQEAANEICALKSRIEIRAALPEAPAVPVVKPLDLSNLLRHAFMFGFQTMGGTAEAAKDWWPEYDPEDCPAFERIRSALVATPPAPTAAVDGEVAEMLQTCIHQIEALCSPLDVPDGARELLTKIKAHLSPGTADIPEGVRQIIFDALDLSEELRVECTADVVNALIEAGVRLASPSPNDGEAKP